MADSKMQFELAQMLRKSHCDVTEPDHECVGEVTIKRGQICLSCQLCGKGQDIPGWDAVNAIRLELIFDAAGIRWDSLDIEAKIRAIREFERQRKGSL